LSLEKRRVPGCFWALGYDKPSFLAGIWNCSASKDGDHGVTVSAERPRLIRPGLLPADPALERYRVHPGAVTAVELDPGDVLTVIDEEGRQRGELTVLADGGRGLRRARHRPDTHAATVLRVLASSAITRPLRERGLDPAQARAVALFGEWSPPGVRAEFAARRDLVAVVGRPAGRCPCRGQPALGPGARGPAGQPAAAGTAAAAAAAGRSAARPAGGHRDGALLRGQAGQYIQVIDVEGRQCSDFLAFCARQLAEGTERGLDATTTRNLTGNAYPQPGLSGKFFDQDMRPLVEVVPGHRSAARHVRAGLQRQVLRGHGVPGPPELHRQLQRGARAVRHRGPARLAGPQLLLQHLLRRGEPAAVRRALVPAGDYVLLRP